MLNATAASVVILATRTIVTRDAGLDANGILQAALMVAGIFVVFLFSAMGTDFLPRLSAVKSHPQEVNRLVNEQMEVAILLSTPGLLLTLALCPWLIQIFYSTSFASAAVFVPWFLAGNLLQIYSWPLGFIQMVLARPIVYVWTQIVFHTAHIGLIALLFDRLNLYAVAVSLIVCYAIYFVFILNYASGLTQFAFTQKTLRLVVLSFGSFGICLIVSVILPAAVSTTLIATLAVVAMVFSAKMLSSLLPFNHKLQPYLAWSRWLSRGRLRS
jgi:PST family polysaccharide transporter